VISQSLSQNEQVNVSLSLSSGVPLSKKSNTVNDQHSPGYLALYGLREVAFSQELDDRFFFLDNEHAQRLSLLHNLIQDHNLFLHLYGDSGVGKTSLINRFVNIGEEDWRFSFFSANTMMNSEQLFFNISAGFGLSRITNGKNDFKETCIKNIALLENSGVIPILIIDDAQELSIDTLKSIFGLVNRWDKNHPKLRIILISTPPFDKILDSDSIKPLRKIISHVMEIEPLSEEQIERYIYFRLSIAGLDGGNPITPDACSVILEKSKGIPARINRLCHIALRDGMEEMSMKDFFDDHNFNFPLRKYLVTGSIMAIFLGVLFSVIEPYSFKVDKSQFPLQLASNIKLLNTAISTTSVLGYLTDKKIKPDLNNSDDLIIENKVKIEKVTVKKQEFPIYDFSKLKLISINDIARKNLTALDNIIKLKIENKNQDEAVITIVKKDNKEMPKVNSISVSDVSTSKSIDLANYDVDKLTRITSKNFPEIISITPIKIISGHIEQQISLFGLHFTQNSKISVYGSAGIKEIDNNRITFVSDTQININLISKNLSGKNWLVITDPENGKSNSKLLTTVHPTITSSDGINIKFMKGEQWILAQKSDLYILHLLGSKRKEEIADFIYDEDISGQYAVFETNRNGVEWYHLILGTYENRDAAKLAVQQFPRDINSPWIRPIKDIQKVIKRFNQNSL